MILVLKKLLFVLSNIISYIGAAIGGFFVLGVGVYSASLIEMMLAWNEIKIPEKSYASLMIFLTTLCILYFAYGLFLGILSRTQSRLIPIMAAALPALMVLTIFEMTLLVKVATIIILFACIYKGFSISNKFAINNIAV